MIDGNEKLGNLVAWLYFLFVYISKKNRNLI